MSTETELPQNVQFPMLTGGEDNIKIYDLNKIFHMSFTYNFDLLKNLIESLIENQTQLQNQISQLQSIHNIQPQFSSTLSKNAKSEDQKKKSSTSPIKLKQHIAGSIRMPPTDIKLEESVNNDELTNKIIVSIKYKKFYNNKFLKI